MYLQRVWVKFVYEGHWIKVKVTGAQKVQNACSCISCHQPPIFIHIWQMAPHYMHIFCTQFPSLLTRWLYRPRVTGGSTLHYKACSFSC